MRRPTPADRRAAPRSPAALAIAAASCCGGSRAPPRAGRAGVGLGRDPRLPPRQSRSARALGGGAARRAGARGTRRLAAARSRRCYRRARTRRAAPARPRARRSSAFASAAEAMPDGMVVLDARQSHRVGERARAARCSASISTRDVGAAAHQPRAPAGVRRATSRRATFASRSCIDSQRDAGVDAVDADRALRRRREAADQPRRHAARGASRGCAAISSPTCRTSSRRR